MENRPKLQQPGAGLPAFDLWISRMGLGFLRTVLSRSRIEHLLRAETAKVLNSVRKLSAEQLKQQVLIPRLTGIEDSSRDWSAAMVLQHLVIVDTGISELIVALSHNQTHEQEVRIADVKPDVNAGQEQLPHLEDAVQTYLNRVATVENLHTEERHAHPWFGEMNAHGWHALAALHTMIHRRQLDAIIGRCSI